MNLLAEQSGVDFAHAGVELVAERVERAGDSVGLGLGDVASTGDHGAHPLLVSGPGQSGLRGGDGGIFPRDKLGELNGGLHAEVVVDARERLTDVEVAAVTVVAAVVIGGERRLARVAPTQQTAGERNPAMIPTPASRAAGSTASSGLSRKAFRMI